MKIENRHCFPEVAYARGNKVAIRDYFVVDLALSTGLRVAEIADLKCKDIFLRDRFCALLVRNGKGGKKRLVRFNGAFKRHYEKFISWKQSVGGPTGKAFFYVVPESFLKRKRSGRRRKKTPSRSQQLLLFGDL